MSIPSPCPCCGAYSLAPDRESTALLAVADVLTIKALEHLGKYLVRASRERYRALGTRPWHLAHTLWQPTDSMVTKALKGAWDVVPAMLDNHGCCGITVVQVITLLDRYVHDLAITGTEHSMDELAYRFDHHLGIPVLPYPADHHDHTLERA